MGWMSCYEGGIVTVREYRCTTNGCEAEGGSLEVEGRYEYGYFEPLNENDTLCPECGEEGETN